MDRIGIKQLLKFFPPRQLFCFHRHSNSRDRRKAMISRLKARRSLEEKGYLYDKHVEGQHGTVSRGLALEKRLSG